MRYCPTAAAGVKSARQSQSTATVGNVAYILMEP